MSMTFISSISAETYTVQTGDSLSTIAKKFYGDDSDVFCQKIHKANQKAIGPDPSQIEIGVVLLIPSIEESPRAKEFLGARSNFTDRVIELINQKRSENGVAPLTSNSQLMEAAQGQSQDMADHNFFSHTGSDGSTPFDRMERAGYPRCAEAENIAGGQETPESAVDAWWNSEGHRNNLLNSDYRSTGVGYAYNDASNDKHYWTQDFGSQ